MYAAADRLIEAADWVVWQLTGVETRNACTAGYKAMWSKRDGFPDAEYFAALDPGLADVVDTRCRATSAQVGERAGGLTAEAAAWTGLLPGTAVAVANVDAHVAVPAATVIEPGRMVMIMGTSTCHMVLGADEHTVPGMCGVRRGRDPARASSATRRANRPSATLRLVRRARGAAERVPREARERGIDIHALLQERAARTASRASPACWRSTGGTATARCSWMSTSAGC